MYVYVIGMYKGNVYVYVYMYIYMYVSYIKIVLYFISIFYVILKKSVQNFCLSKLFCFLVKNENTKRPGFYTLLVTRVFSNFPK